MKNSMKRLAEPLKLHHAKYERTMNDGYKGMTQILENVSNINVDRHEIPFHPAVKNWTKTATQAAELISN